MNNKINEALKQFNREDLIDDGYERDLDSNIEVFLTIKQMIYYNQLQSNWNSLRECIEENKKVAMEYTRKIELSGLCQGDYPVPYYHAIKRIDLDNLYLDKMNELEGKNKNE